jgi:hypothetical protein
LAVDQLYAHKWPSGSGVWLFGIAVRMDVLAKALSVNTEEWDEDGLGLARGAWLKLSTGRVVLVYELAHSIDYLGARGPIVEVDAGEAAALGLSRLTEEVRSELSLTDKQVIDIYDDAEAWRHDAAQAAKPRR